MANQDEDLNKKIDRLERAIEELKQALAKAEEHRLRDKQDADDKIRAIIRNQIDPSDATEEGGGADDR